MEQKQSIQDYLRKSEEKLCLFKREWEFLTREVPDKLNSLVASGIKPKISSNSSGNQIGVSLSFESNLDAAKRYMEQVKEKIEKKCQEIEAQIKDIDKNIQLYLDEGADSVYFLKLVKHLNEWISYIPQMDFEISGRKIEIVVDEHVFEINKKWDAISYEEIRKQEAERYGVSLANLDKHKIYLDAKSQKNSAKTSADMKKAEKAFDSVKEYLDSGELAKICADIAKKLKAKEDEEARAKRELEEARKKEEAEQLKKAVEAYEKEVGEVNKARQVYINTETENINKKYNNAISKLKNNYDDSRKKSEKEIKELSTSISLFEKGLEETSLFAFGKKKQLREEIESFSQKIRILKNEKNKLDSDYQSATSKEKSQKEASLKALRDNAEKQYLMPSDPRKKEIKTKNESLNTKGNEHNISDRNANIASNHTEIESVILDYLKDNNGMVFTATEILDNNSDILDDLSLPRLSSALRNLVDKGLVEKTTEKRRIYYRYNG